MHRATTLSTTVVMVVVHTMHNQRVITDEERERERAKRLLSRTVHTKEKGRKEKKSAELSSRGPLRGRILFFSWMKWTQNKEQTQQKKIVLPLLANETNKKKHDSVGCHRVEILLEIRFFFRCFKVCVCESRRSGDEIWARPWDCFALVLGRKRSAAMIQEVGLASFLPCLLV